MTTVELRHKLHEYIDIADDKHIKAIYVLLEKEINMGYTLDEETIKELERREQEYLSGTGESYVAEESLEIIQKGLKSREIKSGYVYDEDTLRELERRRAEHLAREGEYYTAGESIEMLRKLKK